MIENLIVYILISLSFSYMYSFSTIFRPVRNFVAKIPVIKYPLICPECSSFWVGLFVCFFIYNPVLLPNFFVNLAVCGLIVHLFACILYKKIT